MANAAGKDGVVKVGDSDVEEIRDWSLETTSEVVDDTVMGDEWMSHKPTQKSWTASFTMYWDPANTDGQQTMTEGANVELDLYPQGDTAGQGYKYWVGSATVTSVSKSASFDGMVEMSVSVQGNGQLAESTLA